MSVVLYEITSNSLHGVVRQEKNSRLFHAMITFDGQQIYSNYFHTLENAVKALRRNYKKHM